MFAIIVAGVASPVWADDGSCFRAAVGSIAILGAALLVGGMVGSVAR